MMVCRISAYSIVVWCARNPAWVGECRLRVFAVVVSLAFMVAMKTFARGGGDGDAAIVFRVFIVTFTFV